MMFQGKTVVITGAGSGIGRGAALRFAKEGARVAILDFNRDAAEETVQVVSESGGEALAIRTDVAVKEEVFSAAKQICDRFGRIDVWINAAGITKIVPFLDCAEELWQRTLNINLSGTFYGCQAAVGAMLKNGGGTIINFSSIAGKKASDQYAPYCASKAGVIGLTQSVALEFAKSHIRCNAVCPGIVLTHMWDEQSVDYAKKRDIAVEEVMPRFASRIPMGRLCEMDEITNVLLFLAGEQSSYMTGQAVNVTGGEWRS